MAQAAVKKKKYTYEDYLKTPEDKRYELIYGELLMTPSPIPFHQRISRRLGFALTKFVEENDMGEVFYAPCDVFLNNENVVQPDIFFISKERLNIIGEKKIQGAPDLVVEIISENSAYRDMVQKKRLYAKFGVKEYWIVIPKEGMVEIYLLKDDSFQPHKTFYRNTILESPCLKSLRIHLQGIFS